jgi:sugar O-acyltransferase (sialic acid O-acetyltransferase NeuD family)
MTLRAFSSKKGVLGAAGMDTGLRREAERPFVIIGAGGHACVVAATLSAMNAVLRGLTDRDPALAGCLIMGAPILGDDGILDTLHIDGVQLANGLGIRPKVHGLETPDPGTGPRRGVFETLTGRAFVFPPIVHPSAVIAAAAEIRDGAQVMAGAVVQSRAVIGENAVVNSSASIDHDCHIGAHAFIAPGAIVCGGVRVGSGALIGAGAVILPGLSIGENAVIGAGAVIRRDVKDYQFAVSSTS